MAFDLVAQHFIATHHPAGVRNESVKCLVNVLTVDPSLGDRFVEMGGLPVLFGDLKVGMFLGA